MGTGGGRTRGAAARSVLLGRRRRRRRRWRRRLRLASCSASSSPRPGCRSDGGSSGPGGAEGAGRPAGGQGRREAGSGPGRRERDRAWARAAAAAVSSRGSSCSCSSSRCRCSSSSSSSSRARLHHAAGSHLLERRSLSRRPPSRACPWGPAPARPGPWGRGGCRARSRGEGRSCRRAVLSAGTEFPLAGPGPRLAGRAWYGPGSLAGSRAQTPPDHQRPCLAGAAPPHFSRALAVLGRAPSLGQLADHSGTSPEPEEQCSLGNPRLPLLGAPNFLPSASPQIPRSLVGLASASPTALRQPQGSRQPWPMASLRTTPPRLQATLNTLTNSA